MSMQRPGSSAFGPDEGTQRRSINGGLVAGGVALVVLAIFVLQNTQEVPIKFLFWEFTFALWFALAITIVLTLIAERLGGWAWRRRRRKRAEREG